MARPPEYAIWEGILRRWRSPYYAGRDVYDRWLGKGRTHGIDGRWQENGGFTNFYADILAEIGPRPPGRYGKRPLYTLERIDNERGYEPGNVRWATMKEQAANRRRRKDSLTPEQVAAVRDDSRSMQKIAADYGVCPATIFNIKHGLRGHHR